MTLIEAIRNLDSLDGEATIYAAAPWNENSKVVWKQVRGKIQAQRSSRLDQNQPFPPPGVGVSVGRSTIMTSNRPLEEWGKLLGDVPAAGAILDRFLPRAQVITINGRSGLLNRRY